MNRRNEVPRRGHLDDPPAVAIRQSVTPPMIDFASPTSIALDERRVPGCMRMRDLARLGDRTRRLGRFRTVAIDRERRVHELLARAQRDQRPPHMLGPPVDEERDRRERHASPG
jgi:hypothetical protein